MRERPRDTLLARFGLRYQRPQELDSEVSDHKHTAELRAAVGLEEHESSSKNAQ